MLTEARVETATTQAEETCAARDWRFSDVFRHQFRIGRTGLSPTLGWARLEIGGLCLDHCPSLPLSEVSDRHGRRVAAVLGVAVDAAGRCLGPAEMLDLPDGATRMEALERWIEGLAGRFVALTDVAGAGRLYFDPTAGLTAVYDPEARVVAASPALAVTGPTEPPDGVSARDVLAKRDHFLFGESCDRRTVRVTANHYLDLATFAPVRHWPRPDTTFSDHDARRGAAFDEVAARLAAIFGALTEAHDCALPLTAGMDSRLLLACAGTATDRIRHFYCHVTNWASDVDARMGAVLAEHLNLPFEVISCTDPAVRNALPSAQLSELRRQMKVRTGWQSSGISADTVRVKEAAPPARIVLRGNVAEMTRANKWTLENARRAPTVETGLEMLAKLRPGAPRTGEAARRYDSLLDRYRAWASTLPDPARARLYDLAHMELWMPARPNAENYAFCRNFFVNPYNDRRLIQLTAGVAPLARKRGRMVRAVIARTQPSLLAFPYHRQFGRSLRRAPADAASG